MPRCGSQPRGGTVVGCDLKVDGAAEALELVHAAGGRMDSTAPLDLTDEAAVPIEE